MWWLAQAPQWERFDMNRMNYEEDVRKKRNDAHQQVLALCSALCSRVSGCVFGVTDWLRASYAWFVSPMWPDRSDGWAGRRSSLRSTMTRTSSSPYRTPSHASRSCGDTRCPALTSPSSSAYTYLRCFSRPVLTCLHLHDFYDTRSEMLAVRAGY